MTQDQYSIFNDERIKEAIKQAPMDSSIYLVEGDRGYELKKSYSTESFEDHHRTVDCQILTLDEFNKQEFDTDPAYASIYVSPRNRSLFYPGDDFHPMKMKEKGFKLFPVIETDHSTISLRFGSTKSEGMHWDESISFIMLPPDSELTEVTPADLQCLEDWINNHGCQVSLYDNTGTLICSGDPVFSSREEDALDALCSRLECNEIEALDELTSEVQIVDSEDFDEKFGKAEVVTIRRRNQPGF